MSEGQQAALAAALSHSYRLERELGAGGMATVYLAHDLKHDRKVAVKVPIMLGSALGDRKGTYPMIVTPTPPTEIESAQRVPAPPRLSTALQGPMPSGGFSCHAHRWTPPCPTRLLRRFAPRNDVAA